MRIKYNIRRSIELANFLIKLCRQEDMRNHIPHVANQECIYILANGPSLNQSLTDIINNKRYLTDCMMSMNFFTNDERYEIIKPKYHVISDPMFYDAPGQEDRVADFFVNINAKTTWPITLFVPYRFWKDEVWQGKFTNQNISLIPFHQVTPPYDCLFLNWIAQHGLIGVNFGSVLHHCIYVSLLSGYKEIFLYGADHTFFDGLCVNDNNQVCKKTTHFYDENPDVVPIFHTYTGVKTAYTMSHFLSEYAGIFKGHELLRRIASSFNAIIINVTPGSMIDAYERQV